MNEYTIETKNNFLKIVIEKQQKKIVVTFGWSDKAFRQWKRFSEPFGRVCSDHEFVFSPRHQVINPLEKMFIFFKRVVNGYIFTVFES